MAGYVIIGASLAGASAAITLREHSSEANVTLIGAEDGLPYERPPLSKGYLRGSVPFEKLLVRPAGFYSAHRIDTMFGTRVTGIDSSRRIVYVADGRRVPYDSLLIATGARNRQAHIPGIDLEGVHSLRDVRDADRLRAEMHPGRRAIVVGMGFIGCEVAASLRHVGLEVTTIDRGQSPLARILGEAVGATLAAVHESYGVRMIFNDSVAAFEGGDRVEAVTTSAGVRIPCDFAVLGIGVEPAVGFLDGSGVQLDNGVVVDQYCATNIPGIFAAGDVANHYHPIFGRHIRVEHWQNAMRQGANAARNMLKQRLPYDEVPWFWSDQYDAHIQYAGYHTAYDALIIRGRLDHASYAAFYMSSGVITAVVGFNNAKDVRRAMPLIKTRRPVDPARLRDEGVDLRSLMNDAQTKRISV
jgi:3-phenylpropionate/trans-cinnamate dioxygenase ferredoxin reductase component